MDIDRKILEFCGFVKSGFGTIPDVSVKREFERVCEMKIDSPQLAKLLALLEQYELLDKKNSVNTSEKFYRYMFFKNSLMQ